MTHVRVRRFAASDAEACARIYRRAVERLGAANYTPVQITAWAALAPDAEEFNRRYGDGRAAFVAEADRVLGFADVEADGHIQFLYVDPDAARQGVARALLAAVEGEARSQRIASLSAEASETALPVFERCGFERLHRREVTLGDVAIHNYAVRKGLTNARK